MSHTDATVMLDNFSQKSADKAKSEAMEVRENMQRGKARLIRYCTIEYPLPND